MAKAEARAAATGELDDPVHKKENSDTSTAVSGFTPRAINLLLPVGALIAVMFIALIVTGNGNLMNGSGMKALIWAVSVALFVAAVLCVTEKVFTVSQVIDEIFKGMSGMLPDSTFVLLFGFTMGNVVKSLDTGTYLSSIFQQFLEPGPASCINIPDRSSYFFRNRNFYGNHGYYGSDRTSYGLFHGKQHSVSSRRYVRRKYFWRSCFSYFRYHDYDLFHYGL